MIRISDKENIAEIEGNSNDVITEVTMLVVGLLEVGIREEMIMAAVKAGVKVNEVRRNKRGS